MLKRRHFLGSGLGLAGAGLAGTVLASPALAQSQPSLHWRLMSGFSQSFDILFGAAAQFARAISEATDNQFKIDAYASGELAPGAMSLDWVANGTVELAQVQLDFFADHALALHLASAIPFGLNVRQQVAWLHEAGNALINEVLAPLHVHAIPMGNCGPQMTGWFKNPVTSPADLQGLKIRSAGLSAKIFTALGAQSVTLSRNDIAAALDKGDIDAAEFYAPYDDEKLGLVSRAPHLHFPSFSRPATTTHLLINLNSWNALPKTYQRIIESAAAQINTAVLARYDVQNAAALKRSVASGARVTVLPQSVLEAAFEASRKLLNDMADSDPAFKKLLASALAFRDSALYIDQTSAYAFDNFLIRHRGKD